MLHGRFSPQATELMDYGNSMSYTHKLGVLDSTRFRGYLVTVFKIFNGF